MSFKHHLSFTRTAVATMLAAALTSGCGGGGGGTATTTLDGSVFASAVDGATCGIYSGPDEIIGSTFTTDENGEFSVNIGSSHLANDLALVCGEGAYIDEVDGETYQAGTLAAYVAGGTLDAETSLNATPGSTIVFQLIADYGMDPVAAQNAFQTAFGYTPDVTVTPTDATNPALDASLAALEAGLRAAAFSQLTLELELGQDQQFALLEAIAADLSDGLQNGLNGVLQITVGGVNLPALIGDKFDTAADNFRTRTVTTSSYKFSYASQMMMGMDQEGKNNFQINITDLGNNPATGLTVTVMPMMYMELKTHSTPVDGACVETVPDTSGIYDCTIYYVMASRMMGDMSMGEWDLKVMAGGEAAHFYPEVMMAMGDTAMAKLANSNDKTMDGTTPRTYHVFKSSLTSMMGNHTFELFTATMETMMSFPAVYTNVILNAGEMNEKAITSMSVKVSTDPNFVNDTVTAIPDNNGYWTAAGITDLTDDVEGTLYVRMMINGYTYNTNLLAGTTGEGIYEYATFTVTPASMPMP